MKEAGENVGPQAAQLAELLTELARLKSLPRTGWLLRGVRDVESLADHSFGVAWAAMLLADCARARGMHVDVERVLRMALLHDLTEARTGDLPVTVKKYFGADALHAADGRIAAEMLEPLGRVGADYVELWREYEARASLEARIVKAADKLDLLVQANEYEKGGARALSEFWEGAEAGFAALGVGELAADLIARLRERRVR
jgi:putative hydrolases of HD superfamily